MFLIITINTVMMLATASAIDTRVAIDAKLASEKARGGRLGVRRADQRSTRLCDLAQDYITLIGD